MTVSKKGLMALTRGDAAVGVIVTCSMIIGSRVAANAQEGVRAVVWTVLGAPREAGSRARMTDPNRIVDHRDVFSSGPQDLGEDEVRLIALGTGMPGARRGPAATGTMTAMDPAKPVTTSSTLTVRCQDSDWRQILGSSHGLDPIS